TGTFIKTFYAPLDATHDGVQPNTSYVSNGDLFTGAPTVLPGAFYQKGTSNTIMFNERMAKTNGPWAGTGTANSAGASNYIMNITVGAGTVSMNTTQTATVDTVAASQTTNAGATAYSAAGFMVGLGDGSVRTLNASNAGTTAAKGYF